MSFYLNSFVALTLAIFSDNICIVDIAAHLQASLLPCLGLLIFSVSLNFQNFVSTNQATQPRLPINFKL